MTIEAFATCPKQLELILKDEIIALGGTEVKEALAGVHFKMSPAEFPRLIMWSRLANRIMIKLGAFSCRNKNDLYNAVSTIPWRSLCRQFPDTVAIRFSGTGPSLTNTHFSSQVVKDAVVDQLFSSFEKRPNVVKKDGHLSVYGHLRHNQLTLFQDITGHSLHQRGYRTENTLAPLKENLAAAILIRAGWPEKAQENYHLIDPMCGSGTLLLEGWAMATDLAPNKDYKSHALFSWHHFDINGWHQLVDDAEERHQQATQRYRGQIIGVDHHKKSIELAQHNSHNLAGGARIGFHYQTLDKFKIPPRNNLIVTNPPYGVRLQKNYLSSWRQLSAWLANNVREAQAAILTPDESLAWLLGYKEQASYLFFNGRIPIQLRLMDINKSNRFTVPDNQHFALPSSAQMMANRLKKNRAKLSDWLTRDNIDCYRIYDADIPEYSVAVDCYHDHVVVQEYMPPKTIPEKQAEKHLKQALLAIQSVLQPRRELIHLKTRRKQSGDSQYEKQAEGAIKVVNEQGRRYRVDFETYLDTGLFLDHRWLRRTVQAMSKNKRVLNLFCYTGSISVAAAMGGAVQVDSVDTSKTYLQWAKDNFDLNNLKGKHRFLRQDVMSFLDTSNDVYDLIIVDPPTFSNSHSRDEDWILQQHHDEMINRCMQLLSPSGELYFSNNFKQFKLDKNLSDKYDVKDITQESLDPDFAGSSIHHCFKIRFKDKIH
ncbi:bifunctional 23S rRNA (guanine(2069)-N(7))-methyltransferase RlmK/23S rRNA (guanine(2445)-N(2))-methyltransferase RlmL [Marinicella gelatinilytica]|uniref:bifunctional 23S rRNA (guanine(2069)-N(7))-methyltransferase RlmK/23S rRNA (guanine(2445)-N(2))-methyltransferase RlmL n=1 Tax=Marinicella gelatinilytica TaxID=2996017 RepID=UPI002260A71A|nr:bifunctional 23S rRNA (guanine(2069)-N(7))-methyltransferase RlmK/23S rRNA (guanine(2445)-N(2))-methyltransferase RlmL [Marinicella gelatinilytica]MCX7544757.1 bifunctional 23S rRNA (guanine(2069)-N(7))-methyltransferase RlmK/23S rRNA (guanine(2445)-N(2))-methyltransferase RlmL [Marinicella gelatinilytica]